MIHIIWTIYNTLKPFKGQDFALTDKLLDYGCWCQLRNQSSGTVAPGHGTPVDEIDAACKAWHQCTTCTSIDFNTCDPRDVAYEMSFNPIIMRIDCQFNPANCDVST